MSKSEELNKIVDTLKNKWDQENRESMKDYLYIMECEGYFKIGKAHDLMSRLAGLQVGNPYEITPILYKKFNDALKIERLLHNKFEAKRVRGEWFELTGDDLIEITNILGLNNIAKHSNG